MNLVDFSIALLAFTSTFCNEVHLCPADGQFHTPKGIAVDLARNVYVADTGNNRTQKFTNNGTFVTTWNTTSINQYLANPTGIAVDGVGNLL